MSFSFLVKVKLSLLLLYDGKTAVFSGEYGSFSTFWISFKKRMMSFRGSGIYRYTVDEMLLNFRIFR